MSFKNIYLTFLLITSIQVASAQDWFSTVKKNEKRQGYIIGIAGDTIPGQIQYDYPVVMQKRVMFFQNGQMLKAELYEPEDIRGYSMDEKRWVSTRVNMETYEGVFLFNRFGIMETIPGPIALLRIFTEQDKTKKKLNSEEAEVLYRNIQTKRKPGSMKDLYIKKNEDPATAVFTKEFKRSFSDMIKSYVGDHLELKEKITNKFWRWKDLEKIVNEYNRWFESRYLKDQ